MRTMKKVTLMLLALAFVSSSAFGQLTGKDGTPMLPEADEWGIGFNAVPVMNLFGEALWGAAGGAAAYNGPALALTGKMVVDENTAYRATIGLNFGSNTWTALSADDNATTAGATVEDELKVSTMGINIGAGIQKWRGKGRVRGFYGAELGIGFGSGAGTETYTYGNTMDATNNPGPTTTDFSTVPGTGVASNIVGTGRATEVKAGSTFSLGIRGFLGVEYFFAPKMSLSAEYGWGLAMTSTGAGETTVEDASTGSVVSTTTETGSASSFGIGNDIGGGAINMNFYF